MTAAGAATASAIGWEGAGVCTTGFAGVSSFTEDAAAEGAAEGAATPQGMPRIIPATPATAAAIAAAGKRSNLPTTTNTPKATSPAAAPMAHPHRLGAFTSSALRISRVSPSGALCEPCCSLASSFRYAFGVLVAVGLAAAFSVVLGAAFGASAGLATLPSQGVVNGTSVPSIRLTVSPRSTASCTLAL